MASMLNCDICLERKTDRKPKSLSCLHSFCRECLRSWVDTRPLTGNIECPVCRQQTKIPPNGIDGLVDDFKVLQLEEMMKAIGDPFVCQACLVKGQTSKAKVKCDTCDRRLCAACHQYHLNHKITKTHKIVSDLCEVHGNAISYVCITCFTGVCVDCFLSEVHHEHDVYELNEGMKKLKESVEESKKQLGDLVTNIKGKRKTAELRNERKMELTKVKLKQAADAMKQDIDRQVAEVIRQYRKQTLQELKTSFDKFEGQNLPEAFGELENRKVTEETMTQILEFNTELNKSIRQARAAEERSPREPLKTEIKDVLKEVGKPLSLTQYYKKIDTPEFEIKLQESVFKDMSEKPKLVRQYLEGDCIEIDGPRGLEIMDDFTAVAAFADRDHVARFDENGKVVASYYCNESGDAENVINVTTGDDNIYIQCSDHHTVIHIPASGFKRTVRHITNIPGTIYEFTFNPYDNMFLLRSDAGKVFRCRETDMSPAECSLSPGRIRVLPYAGSYRIVVASWNTNTVMVYDDDETLLYTLTGCGDNDHFNRPWDVSMLGHDTLLVADYKNHRVCKFRMNDGSFEGLLLTEEDNHYPMFIACKYPYLWVTCMGTTSADWALQLYKWS